MPSSSCLVAITGASGAAYGLKLLAELLGRGLSVDLIISDTGRLLLDHEASLILPDNDAKVAGAIKACLEKKGLLKEAGGGPGALSFYDAKEITAPAASGSALRRKMVVVPCSMGTLGRVASGISNNLIDRAADCILKERGTLVLVPRETPLNTIHLENMLRLSKAGAVILPAMPAFYHQPSSINDMVSFVVGKILDVLEIENDLYARWKA